MIEADPAGQPIRHLVDLVVETICNCKDDSHENVQLQVIKALLTATTSNTIAVHDTSLLLAVRACYHIYLVSRNMVNRTTAKATLTQMLNVVFQRMEQHEARRKAMGGASATASETAASGGAASAEPRASGEGAGTSDAISPTDGGGDDEAERLRLKLRAERAASDGDADAIASPSLEDGDSGAASPAAAPAAKTEHGDSNANGETGDSGETEAGETKGEVGGEEHGSQGGMDADKSGQRDAGDGGADEPAEADAAASPSSPAGGAGGADGADGSKPAAAVAASAESSPGAPKAIGDDGEPAPASLVFDSQLHKDAFLLFRALCRLSMKADADAETGAPDPISLQSKVLSLELILSVLEHAGPSFRTGAIFVDAIKQYLCVSLLNNCISSVTRVVGLSLRIFVALVANFKDNLKAEIEVFVASLFLRILESTHSAFEHKLLVLEVFRTLCRDSTAVVELYLNYDCDGNSIDLYENIVHALAKVAQGHGSLDFNAQRTGAQEQSIRMAALQGLVEVMKSIANAADEGLASEGPADGPVVDEDASGAAAGDAAGGAGGAATATGDGADSVDGDSDGEKLATGTTPSASEALATMRDKKKRTQEVMGNAVIKFKVKPKAGIAYMQKEGFCGESADDVAKMLHEYADVLDKTQIGDYMGEDKDFNKEVMYAYVDQMDFTGLTFDQGIRHFLKGFRLPGEAQKIDRMMEKFADRYCMQNPDVFPNADTAFVLSYSVIMLNTDAHNPNIKPERKMTKAGFISNNRGIASGNDLPPEFLSAIYDEIVSNAITLREDDQLREKETLKKTAGGGFFGGSAAARQRREMQETERAEIMRESQELFRSRVQSKARGASEVDGGAVYYQAADVDMATHVRGMFQTSWGPLLAVFSVTLETTREPQMVGLALEGFTRAIHVAARFDLDTERDALVTSLAKFTFLDSAREMSEKNIECIRALIHVALTEGDYLAGAWGPILNCVSQLARLQLFAAGAKADGEFFPSPPPDRRSAKGGRGFGIFGSRGSSGDQSAMAATAHHSEGGRRQSAVERYNAEHVTAAFDEQAIDRVFSNSVRLSSDAIGDFVRQLCAVSLQEVMSVSSVGSHSGMQPRIFSLQKVVEVADFNMDVRPRVVWARIWSTLADYFTKVGCHNNQGLAMFAIDALKQLSQKFLEKAELKRFHFQTMFLQPFETIMAKSASVEIRELVLRVVSNMIRVRVRNIRSGWKTLFAVHAVAAGDQDGTLVSLAFETVHMLLTEYFTLVNKNYTDAVKCLVAFASNVHTLVALRAIDHLAEAGNRLARGLVPVREEEEADDLDDVPSETPLKRRAISDSVLEDEREWVEIDEREISAAIITGIRASDLADDTGSAPPGMGEGRRIRLRRFTDDEQHTRLWWPLLTGLAALVEDSRLEIRTRALDVLFGILSAYGAGFSKGMWELMFRGVLLPMFDDVTALGRETEGDDVASALAATAAAAAAGERAPEAGGAGGAAVAAGEAPEQAGGGGGGGVGHDGSRRRRSLPGEVGHRVEPGVVEGPAGRRYRSGSVRLDDQSWLKTTCMAAMGSLVGLFTQFYEQVFFLLPEVLALLEASIDQEIEGLARIGTKSMQRLLHEAGSKFDSETWTLVVAALERLFKAATPVALMEARHHLARTDALTDSEPSDAEDESSDSDSAARRHRATSRGSGSRRRRSTGSDAGIAAVSTPYGSGKLLGVRDDGFGVVQLPFGVGILRAELVTMLASSAAVPAPLPASPPIPPVGPPGEGFPPPAPPVVMAGIPATAAPSQGRLHFRQQRVVTQCVVQLELIGALRDVVLGSLARLDQPHIEAIATLLQSSTDFARTFNLDRPLRRALWDAGFMKQHQNLPSLLRQERNSTRVLLLLLFRVFAKGRPADETPTLEDVEGLIPADGPVPLASTFTSFDSAAMVEDQWAATVRAVLTRFVEQDLSWAAGHVAGAAPGEPARTPRPGSRGGPRTPAPAEAELGKELVWFTPVVVQTLRHLLHLDDSQLRRHVGWLHPTLVNLITVHNRNIREALQDVFKMRFAALLPSAGDAYEFPPQPEEGGADGE